MQALSDLWDEGLARKSELRPGAPSTSNQGQIRRSPNRTIHPDTVRDHNAKAILIEACHCHTGCRVAVKGLRPFNCQVKVHSHLLAGETGGSDPRARIGASDLAGSEIPGEIGAD